MAERAGEGDSMETAEQVPDAAAESGAGIDWQSGLEWAGFLAGRGLAYSLRGVAAALFLAGRWLTPRQEIVHEDVPPSPVPTLGLAAKVALDELGYVSEVFSTSVRVVT